MRLGRTHHHSVGPKKAGCSAFNILCLTHFVRKLLHYTICFVSSGLLGGRAPKFIFALGAGINVFRRRYCSGQHSSFESAFGCYGRSGLSTCEMISVHASFNAHVAVILRAFPFS